jgi:hypothetical protein
MFKCRRSLRVHAWGGLGSQLFAMALAFDLQKTLAGRDIVIILHTGGVTRRLPEITELYPEYRYILLDDFKNNGSLKKIEGFYIKFPVRLFIGKILKKSRIIASADDDYEFSKLKPWTHALRGHYSYRTISSDFLKDFYSRLGHDSELGSMTNKLSLHFRLGDLLVLNEKKPLSASRVAKELTRICESQKINSIDLYSDSPKIARDFLVGLISKPLQEHSLGTLDVIRRSTTSSYFVGTSSKISFWIAAIRSQVLGMESSLPKENFRETKQMIGKDSNRVFYYL